MHDNHAPSRIESSDCTRGVGQSRRGRAFDPLARRRRPTSRAPVSRWMPGCRSEVQASAERVRRRPRRRRTISISVSGAPKPPALVTSHRRRAVEIEPAIGDARQQIAHDLQRASPQAVEYGHCGVAARGNQGFDRPVAQHAHGIARQHPRHLLRIAFAPAFAPAVASRISVSADDRNSASVSASPLGAGNSSTPGSAASAAT